MRSAAGGNKCRIDSSLVLTSKATAAGSRSQSNITISSAPVSVDVERSSLIPESVEMASSAGRAINSSTSSGVEPA